MTEQPITPERGAELERMATKAEAVTSEATVEIGSWLRFEVGDGWDRIQIEEGEVVKITDQSILVSYKPLRGERKRARISRDPYQLKRRHVRLLFGPGEKEEYRRWRTQDNARRERESLAREQRQRQERLERMVRARALDLLGQEHSARLAELVEQVRPEVEAKVRENPW